MLVPTNAKLLDALCSRPQPRDPSKGRQRHRFRPLTAAAYAPMAERLAVGSLPDYLVVSYDVLRSTVVLAEFIARPGRPAVRNPLQDGNNGRRAICAAACALRPCGPGGVFYMRKYQRRSCASRRRVIRSRSRRRNPRSDRHGSPRSSCPRKRCRAGWHVVRTLRVRRLAVSRSCGRTLGAGSFASPAR